MLQKLFVFVFLLSGCASMSSNKNQVQSRFVGPVQIKVWKSWLESSNVENVSPNKFEFELTRGTTPKKEHFVNLRFHSKEPNLHAIFAAKYLMRDDEWEMKLALSEPYAVKGISDLEWTVFNLVRPELEFVDINEKQIVTEITFKVYNETEEIYSAKLVPMYVRGQGQHYWKNPVDGFASYAGSGKMSVETSLKSGAPWDKWDGHAVQPVVGFIEKQSLTEGSRVGLHRMEKNQKIWLIDSGKVVVENGVSFQDGPVTRVRRNWLNASERETDEFSAAGGWLEERTLQKGDMMIMVPKPEVSKRVSFQGMRALESSSFWVLGKYN